MHKEGMRFANNICLTHSCNLNCIYCYQTHNQAPAMSFEVACRTVDWIFENKPADRDFIEIRFFGGEPLLEFNLIKKIVDYILQKDPKDEYVLYATTNGTLLTDEMKQWCTENRSHFRLGLSLDGTRETQNHNRSNSFDDIDIDYFLQTWPNQGVKMTLSEYSLSHLAADIKYLHSCGFKHIDGVNLFEGIFDWDKDKYLHILAEQFKELVEFYLENNHLRPNQLFRQHLNWCETKRGLREKWCGVGVATLFFDTDGEKYPCPYITPLTFKHDDLDDLLKVDYNDADQFIDEDCFTNCYIYPICPTCAGVNYSMYRQFNKRLRTKCRVFKLLAVFLADLQGKRIIQSPESDNNNIRYYTIEAIKKIRQKYYTEFEEFL
jgi:radical SAM protein with 4Fe4S-binding SPASM domain